ncbi:MAG: hypothetical protein WDO15_23505 [Bacteroidota bacterium]
MAQSLITNGSHHIYNGAFGEKWFDYTHKLVPTAKSHPFDREKTLEPSSYEGDFICITQNETSNGTQVTNEIIQSIRSNNPNHLIAVDATSSMAGVFLDFTAADVWFRVCSEVLRTSRRIVDHGLFTESHCANEFER